MVLPLGARNGSPIPEKSFARLPLVLETPNLIQVQLQSFAWLKTEGIRELLDEISPIKDFTENRFELRFLGHEFHAPKQTEWQCREKEATYAAPLYITAQLKVKETDEIKEQRLFFGDIPVMTSKGTFIINGAERVVVSQLVRSPGAYFSKQQDPSTGRELCFGKLIPYRGAWLEFETTSKDVMVVKVDRKRKTPVTTLLRALGFAPDARLLEQFRDVDQGPDHYYIQSTLGKDPVDFARLDELLDKIRKQEERERVLQDLWSSVCPGVPFDREAARILAAARLEFYRRLRPGEPASLDNANALVENLFFNPRRYDVGRVGRYKLNRRLGLKLEPSQRTLTKGDLLAILRAIIAINNGREQADDIDHLGNRRVRAVGELIQNQLRVGFLRMERVIKEKMTIVEPEQAAPAGLVNIRPVVAAVREFFGGSQLSQFMDQTNPLAELTHKRRLSALGPGGLSRERAGFDVRDVHHSHYGRICPIETPEGPNIGLLGSLATYARTNDMGFIETPYRRVFHELPNTDAELVGRTLMAAVANASGKVVTKAGTVVTDALFQRLKALPEQKLTVRPFVSNNPEDIVYLPADEEERYVIAQANVSLDSKGQFLSDKVEARKGELVSTELAERVGFMDVSPMQIVSVSTALIPFLEHDDANRALMGSNMQRQAVPLLRPEAPLVGTGMERRVAIDSGQVVLADTAGVVTAVSGKELVIADSEGKEHSYPLTKFLRSNQSTCINQRPLVKLGDRVAKGQALADASSTDKGELALGQNVLAAFMSWEGYNFEDAIILSEQLVRDDRFTSVHIERFECEARDTKLGPDEITRDIPNVGEDALRDLDEDGHIRLGAEIGPGDILVGKNTPKG
ncbi:MAG: DNA-directed RNA polymerase subunit beta, partial [Chloroflexi bacterium]|nr:DNA-directed RNA polymerase subunit beta [Chloroflexota bacterium]